MLDMTNDRIEAGLSHLASSREVTQRELIDGLCGLINAQKALPLDAVRPVLERKELGAEGLREIRERFFDISARFLFPGCPCDESHFAHSFLDIALMAKSFEQQVEQAIGEGWCELSSSVSVPDLTDDLSATLQRVISDVLEGDLDERSAESAAELLEKARQEAISSSEPVSESNKLFLVKAGELAILLRDYLEGCNFDVSLRDSRNLLDIKRLAEDCVFLAK
jgi:hypothetical protein